MLALMDRATTLWRIPVVGRAKGRVIRRLIDRTRPTRAIEIGSLLGYSAILIAGALPPRGRLTCVESNPYLAKFVKSNAEVAGLGRRVRVVVGDALRVLPLLSGRFDFVLIDAAKEDYLDYLRQLEPKLVPGALVVADNTGIFRRDVTAYIEHVRDARALHARHRRESPRHDRGDARTRPRRAARRDARVCCGPPGSAGGRRRLRGPVLPRPVEPRAARAPGAAAHPSRRAHPQDARAGGRDRRRRDPLALPAHLRARRRAAGARARAKACGQDALGLRGRRRGAARGHRRCGGRSRGASRRARALPGAALLPRDARGERSRPGRARL